MSLEAIAKYAANPAIWTIYFLVVAIFIFLSFKFNFSRQTWKDFFNFYFGLGGFLAGLGFGFQAVGLNLKQAFNFSYTAESIINLLFIIFYTILFIKFGKDLLQNSKWTWLGAIIDLYFIGCIINILLTGGKYLPFVGWLNG